MTDQDAERLSCPKCGSVHHGPYALLGHIFTTHWLLDDDELPDDWDGDSA